MPTYDYICDNCQHNWEEFQSIKAAALKKCPECGKNKARRVIGPGAGILFKGSGFYITDYRSDSYKKAASADKSASEGKSESKPESSGTKSTSESKPAKKSAKSEE